VASRSRPTIKWMFRGRARSSKWFVRSCSRLVPCWHWLWSLAMLRLPSAARLLRPRSAARSRLRSAVTQLRAVQHQAAPHRAVPLLAVVVQLHQAAPLLLAVPASKPLWKQRVLAGRIAFEQCDIKQLEFDFRRLFREPMSYCSWALAIGRLRFRHAPNSPNCKFRKVPSFDRIFSTATLTTALTGNVYVDNCSNE
jgi:hypothetical protein